MTSFIVSLNAPKEKSFLHLFLFYLKRFCFKAFDLRKSNRCCPIEQISSIYFYFTFPLISKLQLQQLSKNGSGINFAGRELS